MKIISICNLLVFLLFGLPSFAASPAFRNMAASNQAYHQKLRTLDHPPTAIDRERAFRATNLSAQKNLAHQRKQQWNQLKASIQKQYPKNKDEKRGVAGLSNSQNQVARPSNLRAIKNDTGLVTGSGSATSIQFGGNKNPSQNNQNLPVQDGIIMQR